MKRKEQVKMIIDEIQNISKLYWQATTGEIKEGENDGDNFLIDMLNKQAAENILKKLKNAE